MAAFSSVLHVGDELVEFVKNSFGKSEESIAQDELILSEWCRQQAHFPKIIETDWLRRILLRNKFRIEKTKKKLEAYFTLRNIHNDIFCIDDFHPTSDDFKMIMKSVILYPSSKPTKNGERIYIFKINDPNPDFYDFRLIIKWMYIYGIVLSFHDFSVGERMVCDVGKFQMGQFLKINPNDMMKALQVWQEGLSARACGMEFINSPGFIHMLTKLISPLLKKGKIAVHENLESLHKIVPKENLPEELGGTEGKERDLTDKWVSEIEKNWDFILSRSKQVADESLRVGKSHYSDVFGTDGTFKRITID